MKSSLILAGIITVYVVVGFIASETGLTAPVVDANYVPDAPSDGGTLWDKISAALAPLSWAFNAIGGLFQLATYQVEDIPAIITTLIFAPVGFILVFTGIKIARGTGS